MRRALIIGGTGFVGVHMQQVLQSTFEVTSTGREADIRDANLAKRLVARTAPDVVINLASITTVRESFANPYETYRIGFLGVLNTLMALKEIGFQGKMLNVSSSEVYGHPPESELPLAEGAKLRPMSPYAVNKIAAEHLCFQWSQTEKFEVITARPFTHIGPGQSERFAVANFSRQIAAILLGRREPVLHVGNLDSTRDFTDVRDVVAAYVALLERGRSGEAYNVCSGRESSPGSILAQLIEHANIDITVDQDRSLVREREQSRILGTYKKLNEDTGWKPQIPLGTTLADTLSYWIARLQSEG